MVDADTENYRPEPPSAQAKDYNQLISGVYHHTDPIGIPRDVVQGFEFTLRYLECEGILDAKHNITPDKIAQGYVENEKATVLIAAQELVNEYPEFEGRAELQANIQKALGIKQLSFVIE